MSTGTKHLKYFKFYMNVYYKIKIPDIKNTILTHYVIMFHNNNIYTVNVKKKESRAIFID